MTKGANQQTVSVGVRTRTVISPIDPWRGLAPLAGGSDERGGLIADLNGRAWRRGSNRLNMAGVERAVQRETLKAFEPSHGGFSPPGFRSVTDCFWSRQVGASRARL